MTDALSQGPAEARLAALGLQLPEPPQPLAGYRPFTTAGDLIFTAGVVPVRDGKVITGTVGESVSLEETIEAARVAALSVLASLARAAGGLEEIKGVMLLTVYVKSAPGFQNQPEVADGASKLLVAVLGEKGEHARVAVGVTELPRGACLEIQAIACH
jgi:enamine deaminase RidA (YjgF/YER057c/UK114 family)